MTVAIVAEVTASLRGYGTLACVSCDLEVITPLPSSDALRKIYQADYRLHDRPSGEAISGRSRLIIAAKRAVLQIHDARFGRLARGHKASRVLDVGFGSGSRLLNLAQQGWDVSGLEVASGPVERMQAMLPKGSFQVGSIDDAAYPECSFDLILMYHVLEHLDDPAQSLKTLAAWLRPGGTLIIAVPNRASMTHHLFRAYWYGYEHPEHLVQYTRRSLDRLALNGRMEILRERPQPYYHAIGDSLGNIVDPDRKHPMRRRIAKAIGFPAGFALVMVGDPAALELELRRA